MKAGETAVIPLTVAMLADNILRPGLRTGEFCFSSGVKGDTAIAGWSSYKMRIDAAITAELGKPLPAWTWHDLRRACATNFAEHGADRHLVSLLLNHTDGHVTGTYDRRS
jgi:hypothetical protein